MKGCTTREEEEYVKKVILNVRVRRDDEGNKILWKNKFLHDR